MAIKSVSIRIEEEMLQKIGFVADYEGRNVNSHILVLMGSSWEGSAQSVPHRVSWLLTTSTLQYC